MRVSERRVREGEGNVSGVEMRRKCREKGEERVSGGEVMGTYQM